MMTMKQMMIDKNKDDSDINSEKDKQAVDLGLKIQCPLFCRL